MILLCGLPGDAPMAQVHAALDRLAEPVFFFDQREVVGAELELRAGAAIAGILRVGGRSVDLANITAVYMRLYETRQLPALRGSDPTSAASTHAHALVDALCGWVEVTPILVVNRPSMMTSNGSKPYQLRLIAQCGFRVPDTLVTTDRTRALAGALGARYEEVDLRGGHMWMLADRARLTAAVSA